MQQNIRPPWAELPPALREAADPARMLRQAAVEWLKIGVMWLVMLATGAAVDAGELPAVVGTLVLVVAVILVAGRLQALGVVLHDACHMPNAPGSAHARRDPRLRLLAVLAGHPIATTIEAMRFHHLRHHRFSCLPADPYLKRGLHAPGASRARAIALRLVGALITPFWTVRALLGTVITIRRRPALDRDGVPDRLLDVYRRVFLQDRGPPTAPACREALACAHADPAQLLFFAASLVVTWRWPAAAVIGYWLPLTLAGMLNAHRVISEHRHVDRADDGLVSMLATTVSHRGPWGRVVFYPRNIGLHEAHHLYPTVPLAALPALDDWLRMRRVISRAADQPGG